MAFNPNQYFSKFDFQSYRHVLVAVSGGSDSVGLLCALRTYLKSLPFGPMLSAVTVDHALRDGSAAEAAGVAALCAKLKVPHVIKQWQGAKPLTGIQATARHERRALLCQTATELDAHLILTGHTVDDQIETVVMRQRRGSGPGLAGIATASLAYSDRSDGRPIWIARPLLGAARTDIRDYLLRAQIPWIDDPSNDNTAYERIAVRHELKAASEAMRRDIVDKSSVAASKRERLSIEAADLLQSFVREAAPGLIRIDTGAFATTNVPPLCVLLRTLIAFAGGAASHGDSQITEDIRTQANAIGRSLGAKPWRETSNGALIEVRQTGVYLLREGRKKQRNHLEFDGRYRSTGSTRCVATLTPNPEGPTAPASLVRRSFDLEPLYGSNEADKLTAFEAARSGYPLRRLINPWPDLVPLFDLALAENLSLMAGAGGLPTAPVYRHGKN